MIYKLEVYDNGKDGKVFEVKQIEEINTVGPNPTFPQFEIPPCGPEGLHTALGMVSERMGERIEQYYEYHKVPKELQDILEEYAFIQQLLFVNVKRNEFRPGGENGYYWEVNGAITRGLVLISELR